MYNSQYYTCEQIDERLLQGYLDDYNSQNDTNLTKAEFLALLFNTIGRNSTVDNLVTQIGYYECDTNGSTAAKAINVANYALFAGGSIKVKFINKNTANNATLNINSQGAKALYYQGERASATNSWDDNEVVEIYYDGTSYYANNIKGGSGSGVYDVSKEHPTSGPNGDGKFTLEYILNSSNVNELIPVNKREPGMTIQFVSTSDNKYVQYRLIPDEWSTNTDDWSISEDNILVENPQFVYINTTPNGRIVWGITSDYKIYYGAGLPPQVIDYIQSNYIDKLDLQQLLNGKVDKVDGKALSSNDFTDTDKETLSTFSLEDCPEFMNVEVDKDGYLMGGRKEDGTKFENMPFETQVQHFKVVNNPEWLDVTVINDRIVEGLKKDGTRVIFKLNAPSFNYTHQSWLFGKNWATLGDSITFFKTSYTTCLVEKYKMKRIDVSFGGAKWQNYYDGTSKVSFKQLVDQDDVNSPANVIMNQVYRLLRKCTPISEIVPEIDENTEFMDGYSYPVYGTGEYSREDIDLVTIAAGVNDRLSQGELGNVLDFSNVNYADCDKRILVGAMKWACIVLMKYFPKANIVILAPMQAGDQNEEHRVKLFNIVQKQIEFGQYFGFPVMNQYQIVPINREIDTPTHHRYSDDGLHPNSTGIRVQAECVASYLESILHYSFR